VIQITVGVREVQIGGVGLIAAQGAAWRFGQIGS